MSCSLVYVDIGTNVGDSLEAFAMRKPEERVRETLNAAVGRGWEPATTCAYGFEPNPRWTTRLRNMQTRLAPRFANLTIFTETAIGGPEQVAQPMWLVAPKEARGVFAHLTVERPQGKQAKVATPVTTLRLSSWLRDVCAPRHGIKTPVVMRMDIEGVEYDTLFDLAAAGIGYNMDLYVTVEWHRGAKRDFLTRDAAYMDMLDHRFKKYWSRCGNGSCNSAKFPDGPPGGGGNATLEGSLEKTLVFMLHRAGITYADAFFDVDNPGSKRERKIPSKQDWGATRERRTRIKSGLL